MEKNIQKRFFIVVFIVIELLFAFALIGIYFLTKNIVIQSEYEMFISDMQFINAIPAENEVDLSEINSYLHKGIYIKLYDNAVLIDTNNNFSNNINKMFLSAQQNMFLEDKNPINFNVKYDKAVYKTQILNETCFASFASVSLDNNNFYSILAIKPLNYLNSNLNKIFKNFLMVFLLVSLCIMPTCYILSKWFIKPFNTANIKQNEFVAVAGHELKTPLAVIQSSAELISIDKVNESKYIENIINETQNMSFLVKNLLEYSTISKAKINKNAIILEEFMNDIYETFMPLAKQKNQILIYNKTNTYKQININTQDLTQIVNVFLSNAIEHNKCNTNITLYYKLNYKNLIIYVKDDGEKINKNEKDKIFDKFYSKSKFSKNENYGLGLSIAKELAKKNKWSIALSTSENEGKAFSIKVII